MSRVQITLLIVALLVSSLKQANAQELPRTASQKPLLLAHYMPWYVAKPESEAWGWHWTMNHFDPDKVIDDKREIASHYYPLIGPYDSGDKQVLEYHLLTMKMAGIDGVIVDWYGLENFRDYAILHRNTTRALQTCERLKMKFVICYEDQTIPALVEAGRVNAKDRVQHAQRELEWLGKYWFKSPSYVKLNGKPVLLSFGHAGLTNEGWSRCLQSTKVSVAYFSEHSRREAAVGAFDWPVPKEGLEATKRFAETARDWPHAIPVAFPRFVDVYAKAKLHDGYGVIEDNAGQTFRTTLEQALVSRSAIVQLATWNDWGEGTNIEPSHEFGYRDLQVTQSMRRNYIDDGFAFTPADLRLPYRLLVLRRKTKVLEEKEQLDQITAWLATGDVTDARLVLEQLESKSK